ncbi:MAG: hypothetical protein KDD69_11095 [Bdellovibrionales bacterium]|nr:hypothetical protein [Bdellovibrionales bacterium]
MKAVQHFTKEYLESCKSLNASQIATFLEDFRELHRDPGKSKLVSIKIPERLLTCFRQRAELLGVPYQTQIKILMSEWLEGQRATDSQS